MIHNLMLGLQSWFFQELHIMSPLTSLFDHQVVKVCDLNVINIKDKMACKFFKLTEGLVMMDTPISAQGP